MESRACEVCGNVPRKIRYIGQAKFNFDISVATNFS